LCVPLFDDAHLRRFFPQDIVRRMAEAAERAGTAPRLIYAIMRKLPRTTVAVLLLVASPPWINARSNVLRMADSDQLAMKAAALGCAIPTPARLADVVCRAGRFRHVVRQFYAPTPGRFAGRAGPGGQESVSRCPAALRSRHGVPVSFCRSGNALHDRGMVAA